MNNAEAIEILQREDSVCIETDEALEAYELAIKALELVNDSQNLVNDLVNEKPKGKWIEHVECGEVIYYECSCCNEPYQLMYGTPQENLYNYCPNCGAMMEIENEH